MELLGGILAFMEKGGDVLWLIAALVFFMWMLIIERFIYFSEVVGKPIDWLLLIAGKAAPSESHGMQSRSA